MHPFWLFIRLRRGEFFQCFEIAFLEPFVTIRYIQRADFIRQLSGVDQRNTVIKLAHFTKLNIGKFRFDGAAAADDVYIRNRRGLNRLGGIGRQIRIRHFIGGLNQNACDIDGDIADADDGSGFRVEPRVKIAQIRMRVIPTNKGC